LLYFVFGHPAKATVIKDPSNMDLLNFLRHTTAAFGLEKLTWAVLASLSIRMDWKRERERNIHNSPPKKLNKEKKKQTVTVPASENNFVRESSVMLSPTLETTTCCFP